MKFLLSPLMLTLGVVLGGALALFFLFGAGPRSLVGPTSLSGQGQHMAMSLGVSDISPKADNLPPPIAVERRGRENKKITVNLKATQVVANLADGTTYEYWTYDNQVPGPFIRVMEGDDVEISLSHEHAHAINTE